VFTPALRALADEVDRRQRAPADLDLAIESRSASS